MGKTGAEVKPGGRTPTKDDGDDEIETNDADVCIPCGGTGGILPGIILMEGVVG